MTKMTLMSVLNSKCEKYLLDLAEKKIYILIVRDALFYSKIKLYYQIMKTYTGVKNNLSGLSSVKN